MIPFHFFYDDVFLLEFFPFSVVCGYFAMAWHGMRSISNLLDGFIYERKHHNLNKNWMNAKFASKNRKCNHFFVNNLKIDSEPKIQ